MMLLPILIRNFTDFSLTSSSKTEQMNKQILIAIATMVWLSSPSTNAVDLNRGQALYEIRCIECHDVSVHGRQNHAAKSYDDIRRWVIRWNNTLGGLWDTEDIEDVNAYLNSRYYRYPCTGLQC
jgi:mono/diheme cytochrome c family protein